MRHHIGAPIVAKSDSSSDEDDAFSVFNRKKSRKSKKIKGPPVNPESSSHSKNEDSLKATEINQTSSATASKRHHYQSKARGAKMDALLQELQDTSTSNTVTSAPVAVLQEKMGSFVTPDEEPFTTNIFVGNLAPVTTEEELKEIFRQFGALFLCKQMKKFLSFWLLCLECNFIPRVYESTASCQHL